MKKTEFQFAFGDHSETNAKRNGSSETNAKRDGSSYMSSFTGLCFWMVFGFWFGFVSLDFCVRETYVSGKA